MGTTDKITHSGQSITATLYANTGSTAVHSSRRQPIPSTDGRFCLQYFPAFRRSNRYDYRSEWTRPPLYFTGRSIIVDTGRDPVLRRSIRRDVERILPTVITWSHGGRPNPELIQKVNQLSIRHDHSGMHLVIPYAPIGNTGFIAYTSNRGGQFDIWLLDLRTGENKQLTTGLADSFSKPVWSPDSRQIAFVGKDAILYVIYVTMGSSEGLIN